MINDKHSGSTPDFSGYRLGNYHLIRLLGQGSFASVYLGEHLYLKRPAAIKMLKRVLTRKEQERFLEEARLLANLSHPHIVSVLEFAVAHRWIEIYNVRIKEHLPYLVMDYAPGGTLRTLYMGRSVPLQTVITHITQVAAALQYAHERNIIHRDIKPENLLMNERQEVMLSDFGLALFAPSSDTLDLQGIVGTLHYAAPEQLQGKPSFASDQYSLAIVAYEWLCGSRPFGGDAVELAMHHASSSPPRLRSKNPSVSQAVEEVVLKALAKDPQQRYPTVQAFAEALEQASRAPKRLPATRKLSAIVPSPAKRESPAFHNLAQRADEGPDQEYASRPVWELERQLQAAIVSSMKRNRLPMIQKVRTYWVHGVLKQSLHGASFLSVGLDERPDVVASPWSARLPQSVTVHQSERQPQSLTPTTSITEIYDQAGGEVLILGEPGSGKTTLLLELTRHLLDRAEHNELAPIPVVFLLASWAEKRLSIDQWLVEELHHKYQVPRLLAEAWVRKEMLLPLLDGLDEVAANVRSACVVAINTYKQGRGLSPLVVSSRLRDYLLFPPRVLLHSAVVLRPLTMPQIEGYLRSSGAKFEIIFQMLSEDPMVQRLVTTPLMLHIITLAYQNTSPEDLLKIYASLERYQGILSTYVEQMLQHHAASTAYQPQQMVGWLTRLARHAQRYGHGQSVFYIEQIQPEWINTEIWMQVYRWFAVLLPGTLIGALTGLLGNVLLFHAGSIGSLYVDTVYGMVMGYLLSDRQTQHSASEVLPGSPAKPEKPLFKGSPLQTALVVGLITFLCLGASKDWTSGLANGLILGILSVPLYLFFQRSKKASIPGATSPGKRPFPLQHLTNGVLVGLACGLTSVITLLVTPQPGTTITYLLVLDLRDSLRNALLGTLLSLVLASNDGIIRPAEIVSWSWKRFWQSMGGLRNVVQDILIGLVIAVIFASKQLFQGNMNNVFGAGASTGLLVALGMHLVYAIFQGVSSANLDNRRRSRPNEGIRRSLRYSLLWGIIGMCIATILSIVTTVINAVLSDGLASLQNRNALLANLHLGLANALLLGPAGGLLVGLLLGGLACLQHGVLRLILSMTKVLPLKLARFLDDAVDSVFLHRVGGGYLFIHRLLLEHFASLDEKQAHLDRQQESTEDQSSPETVPLVRLL